MKKPQKHDTNLQKNSTLYFQVGLILYLLASYGLFEMNFEKTKFIVQVTPIDKDDNYFIDFIPIPEKEPVIPI